jgi:hypothetical protein
VSHELRTPLNAIIGFAESLQLGVAGGLAPKQSEYVGDIHRSGLHLLDLISDVLDLSKIDAGMLELREENVRIDDVLEACERLMKGRAKENRVRLSIERNPALPSLRADPIRLKQVLLNLLSNAIKFTPAGGSVTLVATEVERCFRFTVQDTGIGMHPEQIPIALEPFRQLEEALSRRHEGVGLGLPLTKRLVELHDGSLSISSAPGVGTCVVVSLPGERLVSIAPDGEPKVASAAVEGTTARDERRELLGRPSPAALDHARIADWTARIGTGDLREVARVFMADGLQAPLVQWEPAIEDMPAEQLRFVLDYWLTLRGAGRAPHHGQVDPVAMRPALGYVLLLDSVDDGSDFRYRIYGSAIARISGFDMTGRLLSTHLSSPYAAEFTIAATRACVRYGLPLYTERQPARAERTLRWPRIALPLCEDSGAISRVLVATVPLGYDGKVVKG